MNLIPVVSSNISQIGYENSSLYVLFNNGSLYEYFNVPEILFNNLMSAPSHGQYLDAHIKKGGYRYRKIH